MTYLKRNLIPLVVALVAIAGITVSTVAIVHRAGLGFRDGRFSAAARAGRAGGTTLGVQVDDQLKVTSVLADSAALAAGVKVGDQLASINGHAVKSLDDVRKQLDAVAPNRDYALKVNRDGKSVDLTVRSAATTTPGSTATPQGRIPLPGTPGAPSGPGTVPTPAQPPSPRGGTTGPRLGVGIEAADGGVRVGTVTPGSAAAAADLRAGDVITAANGKPTATVEDLQGAVTAAGFGGSVALTVTRDGKSITVTVRLGQRPAPTRPGV